MSEPATPTSPAPDLAPKHCPACGRSAVFRYTNAAEAAKRSPLCWADSERDCPGYVKPAKKEQAND